MKSFLTILTTKDIKKLIFKHLAILFLLVSISFSNTVIAQPSPVAKIKTVPGQSSDPFGIQREFVQNIGQYGDTLTGFGHMGHILFGYEGIGMPVLFTKKGWIHLQRKVNGENLERKMEREREERERKGKKHKTGRRMGNAHGKRRGYQLGMDGANPNPKITTDNKSSAYHSYGYLKQAASAFRKITFQNLYPGIDLVFSFNPTKDHGFEYNLILHPGSDIGNVQLKIGGSYKRIRKRLDGTMFISSPLGDIDISTPISYYGTNVLENAPTISSVGISFENDSKNNVLYFRLPKSYDNTRTLIIDPFVSGTGSLVGLNNGKAKDVDFDYAGNVYVTGGGDGSTHKLAKYDASGTLLWTFSGTLTLPSWSFGLYWGGWMVEKPTGNVYLGQGFNPTTGFQVIRVSTTGLYDNYITTANANFREAWKMLWSCNNGSPQILVAGGGTNSNINFGVFTPPATTISSLNVTGIAYTGSAGWAQDIVDFVIDPSNNDMYTLYGSLIGNPSLTNKIYKNTFPYSGASVAWNIPSGFTTVQEIANRPYLLGGQIDNSANIFAINGSYLFFWDGKNLKAFDKATGNGVGTALTTANAALMQGGIVADACNNVFVGEGNGIIKVYKFNGSTFDDAGAPDISIGGNAGKAVYDLAYDESKKIIYASGDGFVASFDVSTYCPTTQYTLIATPNCLTSSVSVIVSPAPQAGSIVNFTLYNGTTQIATNTTGIFSGLLPGITYTVVATINQACSGQQATVTFTMPGPAVTVSTTNTSCGLNTGTITANGSGSTAPYTYSIDGINYQLSGNFTGLAAGVYTVSVKDAAGCITTKALTILNSNGPSISVVSTNADCGSNNGTITATVTGGTAPYQYSLNGGPYQGSNFFTGLLGGTYTLTVKDASGCTNSQIVTITSSPRPSITAIPATASCGSNNGSITAFGSGGTAPLQYSINGNIFQSSGNFVNLTPGSYTVTVKDVNGCTQTTTVTIDNSPAPTVTAIGTSASCNNVNGIVTASGTGGIAPLQYSINGTFFQTGNIFTGLAAGTYTITVKDATGCTNIVSVTVGSIGGPTASATSTVSVCNANTGSISITGTGGTPGYAYSINGVNFQVSNVFTALAAGNYVAYVRDANGCIGTFTVVVSNTAGPSITVSATTTACNSNTGVITAIGAGGTAPLQYSIDGITYQASNTFTGLATGMYTVYVKDANGCARYTTVTVVNVSNLSLTTSAIFSSCSTSSGVITATATGGIAPLTYSIDGVNYFASNVFNGLAPGVYSVYVKDANGCIVSKQTTIQSSTGPSLTLTGSNGTCGAANGFIFANGTGGITPYTYSLDGGAFQPIRVFVNVAAGVHNITIQDATGCTAVQSITITSVGTGIPPTDVTFRVRDALPCTGGLGRIKNLKGEPSGGGAKYTFSLDFGPFATANQFINIPPGVHTISAMNDAGCTITKIVTIGSGTPATATATTTPAACNTPNGSITISGVGVNTPYHASFDNGASWVTFFPPGANTATIGGLAPGTYPVIMADDADFTPGPPDIPGACLTTIYVVVPASNGPSISTTQINGTCNAPNGSITATGSGGTAPYSYNINGGPYFASGVFNNLAPGNYAVGIKDATGCTSGANIILTNAPNPTITAAITATSCNQNNGTITATATGGTAPLEYSINGTVFQNSNVFTNMAPGTYTVYVKDVTGCYGTVIVTIANTPIPKVTAFTIAATCNNNDGSIVATGTLGEAPYTYSINGTAYQSSNTFSNLAAGFYTIYIKDNRGCISTTGVSVGNTQAPVISNTVVVPANCNNPTGSITVTGTGGTAPLLYSIDGINFQAGVVFSALLPGDYIVYVRDANGCLSTKAVNVGNLPGPQTLTATILNAACGQANGSITALATGGTAPLQYSLDGVTYQASTLFTNKAAGTYTLYVKDANGCIKTLQVVLINLPGPIVSTSSSPATCGSSDGSITATVTGGTGAITYSIDGINFQASNIFTGLAAGTYTITAKDARGCINTTAANVNTSGSSITPVFAPVGPICSGNIIAPLPTTSLNGIIGTWTPALNNTTTTTYLFTPAVGQCANSTTLTIVVNPNVIPTFTAIAPICSGGILSALPTTSLNGVTGTWAPALDNTTTTTYTFTPTAGQCATSATLTITVNPNVLPTFNPVAAICSGGVLAALPTTSLNGITGTWAPTLNNTTTTTYTFTPTAGQCATTTTLIITVNPNVLPTFNPVAAICSGSALTALPTTSLNGITGTWAPALNNTTTTTYTFTPTAGQCATTTTLIITANPNVLPTFNPVAAICSGSALTALPTTSLNGITGTWTPALDNTTTTTYTFTPTAGQCATTTSLTIIVNPTITPTFNPVAAICSGTVLAPLPTTSTNGITGTWSPALNNTATTTYTFTPTAGQCATPTTLVITVNPRPAAPIVSIVQPSCITPSGTTIITSSTTGLTYSLDGGPFNTYPGGGYTGLTPGAHTLVAQNASGCISDTTAFTINAIPIGPSAIGYTSNNATCGNSNGSITLGAVTGGTAPFTYSFDGSAFSSTINYINLAAGNHTVVVSDVNGCTYASTVVVNNATGATVTANNTNSTCGNPNGSITAIGTGGTVPYQYSIDGVNFQAATLFNGLTAGSYTITIRDANGCINTTNITILNTAGATVTAISSNSTCGNSNGSITAAGVGGTAPYQYSIDGTNFQLSNNFTTLAAGTYTITIKDANNCASTTIVTIVNNNVATITGTSTNTTCNGNTGTITLTGSGGLSPYQFSIDGINYQPGNIFTGLAAGNYIATIKDANNCTNTVSIIVLTSQGATVNATLTNSSCGNANGIITATGTGGASPYQFSIDGINFQSSNSFTGLSAGSYTINIKDANGCINSTTATIINIPGATITATSSNSHCGNADGRITATGNGGTSPYQYSIDGTNFQNSNSFTGLNAGSYSVTIKDVNSCLHTTTVIVSNTAGATVSGTSANSTCGNANGSITATGTGGTTPYQYSIDGTNFQPGANFNNLIAGNYSLTIKDANNCTSTFAIIVNNTSGVTVTATSISSSCGNDNGIVTATGSGGSSPYQYSINGTTFQGSPNFTGLAAGTYTISIKDANGCINTVPITVALLNPITIDAGPDQTICEGTAVLLNAISNGVSFQWTPSTGLSNASILKPLAAPRSTTQYVLTATDGQCSHKDTVVVTVRPAPIPNAGSDITLCFGVNGKLNGTGGSAYNWSPAQYLSNTNTAAPTILAPPTGTYRYILNVTDNSGCQSLKADTVIVKVAAPVKVFAGNDTMITINQPLQLKATDVSNSGFISYSWSPARGLNNPSIQRPIAVLDKEITYTVTARTANGCEATDDIHIKVFLKADLFVPNAFTPNNDGRNDVLHVIPVGIKELKYFRIYNRWGQLVYSSINQTEGWNGQFNGQLQPTATFVWIAEGIDYQGNTLTRKGTVTLIR